MRIDVILKQLALPAILIIILVNIFLFGDAIDLKTKQTLLSLSLLIKSIILLIMPIFMIIFITGSLIEMRKNLIHYFITLIAFIFVSNFIAVLFGYGFFNLFSNITLANINADRDLDELQPLFEVSNFQIISNSTGLVIGFVIGVLLAIKPNIAIANSVSKLQNIATLILKLLIIPMLPILIAGFAIKIQHEQIISSSFKNYKNILLSFFLSQALYIMILLFIVSKLKVKRVIDIFLKILPASLTGFSTFSSVATMPVTIECTKKILNDKDIAKAFIPASVNIHLIGTAIGMNIIILSCLQMYGVSPVSIGAFIPFAFYFAIMMFAVVGVPGGSIFAIAPLIEYHLGAGSEIIALITTLVLLFDPIDTSFNVTANTLFAKIFEFVNNLLSDKKASPTTKSEFLK